jgi:S-phase kinase-associated protein 1
MIEIKTMDQGRFKVDEKYAFKSLLIRNICTLTTVEFPIPLRISSQIFDIINRFMKIDTTYLSQNFNPLEIRFRQCDVNFFIDYDSKTLLDICNAANYLEYAYLLELCCKIIAGKLKYKSSRELREFIGLECDISEDTAQNIDLEFGWMSSDE